MLIMMMMNRENFGAASSQTFDHIDFHGKPTVTTAAERVFHFRQSCLHHPVPRVHPHRCKMFFYTYVSPPKYIPPPSQSCLHSSDILPFETTIPFFYLTKSEQGQIVDISEVKPSMANEKLGPSEMTTESRTNVRSKNVKTLLDKERSSQTRIRLISSSFICRISDSHSSPRSNEIFIRHRFRNIKRHVFPVAGFISHLRAKVWV